MTSSPEASAALFFGMSLDMIIGMALGMVASPLMMKGIKIIRHKRKLDKLFREMAQVRENAEDKERSCFECRSRKKYSLNAFAQEFSQTLQR
jgi:hypothetical protein